MIAAGVNAKAPAVLAGMLEVRERGLVAAQREPSARAADPVPR
jgi:hypothetical protein